MHEDRHRANLIFFSLLLLLVCSAIAPALATAPPTNSIESLRLAIDYLGEKYGENYPTSRFLDKLKQLDPKAKEFSAKLAQLRKEAISAHPHLAQNKIVYVVRNQFRPDHHNTGTIFLTDEVNAGSFRGGGAIKTLNLADGDKVETVFESPDGVVRDLELSYDGKKLLFSMRRGASENYHIFELEINNSNLRQLTFEPSAADIDPVYLPDGRIIFGSTRDPKYCGCNQHIQSNLFLMNADGSNIRQVGRNNLFEARPSVLPDGRVIYDRWEYVDRHYGPSFGLWTMMPDGRSHALYYGNNAWSPGAIFDARALPGTDKMVAIFGACHDRPWGSLVVLDRRKGLDGQTPLVRTWPKEIKSYLTDQKDYQDGRTASNPMWQQIDHFAKLPIKYEDPWPLDETFILCTRMTGQGEQTGIFLVDFFGNEVLLHSEAPGCFDPMPLAARKKPPVLADAVDLTKKTGTFYIADVYHGSAMENVPRGTIKTIRVVEAPPKRHWTHPLWRSDTLQRPAMNFNCTNNKRILGDAPVEEDGSAYFEVPAERFVFFQALDKDGMMVQSMRSGTTLQPGERAGCVGCHERRLESVETITAHQMPIAMTRAPSKLKPWHGPQRNFNYLTEVQPVFDRHCIECHDYGKKGGKGVNLCGDLGIVFNLSYLSLRRKSPLRWFADKPGAPKELIKAVDDGPPEVLPPYAWGSHRSRLIDMLKAGHNDVKLSEEELDRLITWIDLNASYYGTYESNYPNHLFGRCPLNDEQLNRLSKLTGAPIQSRGIANPNSGKLINFTRPEKSDCLEKLDPGEPDYREALEIIKTGARLLKVRSRADMPNFKLVNPVDQRRICRIKKNQSNQQAVYEAISTGQKVFEKTKNSTSKTVHKSPLRWHSPTAVTSASGTAFPKNSKPTGPGDPRYMAAKAIDGNPDTFTCLLDDTPGGNNPKTIPPSGNDPTTGHMVLDLGRPYLVYGMRITSRKPAGPYGPKRGDIFAYTDLAPKAHPVPDDIENDPKIISILDNHQFKPCKNGNSESLTFQPVVTRYIGLRVDDSHEQKGNQHYNFQIAELDFLVTDQPKTAKLGDRTDELKLDLSPQSYYQKKQSLVQTMIALRDRLNSPTDDAIALQLPKADASQISNHWSKLRADFPTHKNGWLQQVSLDWFDTKTGWFSQDGSTELEQIYLLALLEPWSKKSPSTIELTFKKRLQNSVDRLVPGKPDGWLKLVAQATDAEQLCRNIDSTNRAIDHLATTYPTRFSPKPLHKRLSKLTERALQLIDSQSDASAIQSEIEKLQHEALVQKNPLLASRELLFAKRHAYCGGWYYADFMRVTKYGGNLCRLSIDTGKVTDLVPELDGGVFDRFDLSFDGKRIVFGYKKEAKEGFRLYEVGVW
jgi:Hydrazine synthase alpha subunit middle domain